MARTHAFSVEVTADDGFKEAWTFRAKKNVPELFIHFRKKRGQKIIVFRDGGEKTKQPYYDHLSFHKDGIIHLRGKDRRGKPVRDKIYRGNPPISRLSPYDGLCLFAACSVSPLQKELHETSSVSYNCDAMVSIPLGAWRPHSMIAFLKCRKVSLLTVLESFGIFQDDVIGKPVEWKLFSKKTNGGFSVYGLDLVVVIVPRINRVSSVPPSSDLKYIFGHLIYPSQRDILRFR